MIVSTMCRLSLHRQQVQLPVAPGCNLQTQITCRTSYLVSTAECKYRVEFKCIAVTHSASTPELQVEQQATSCNCCCVAHLWAKKQTCLLQIPFSRSRHSCVRYLEGCSQYWKAQQTTTAAARFQATHISSLLIGGIDMLNLLAMYWNVGEQLCSSKHRFADVVSSLLRISSVSYLEQRVAVGALIAARAGATLHSEHKHTNAFRQG